MAEKIMTLLVGILVALGGWTLTRTFNLSTDLVVSQEKVQRLELQVMKLQEQMYTVKDKEKEIIDQHKKLFDILDRGDTPTTGYNY
jgi:hypothetical protein